MWYTHWRDEYHFNLHDWNPKNPPIVTNVPTKFPSDDILNSNEPTWLVLNFTLFDIKCVQLNPNALHFSSSMEITILPQTPLLHTYPGFESSDEDEVYENFAAFFIKNRHSKATSQIKCLTKKVSSNSPAIQNWSKRPWDNSKNAH